MRLLGLELKSDNTIKSKLMKFIVKFCPIISNIVWLYFSTENTMETYCVSCEKYTTTESPGFLWLLILS